MKLYGKGLLNYPGSNRVVWDFTDGPFDTCNPILISAAKAQGFTFEPPDEEPSTELKDQVQAKTVSEMINEPKDTPKKRGRKPKGK